jgi:hypothetical protein
MNHPLNDDWVLWYHHNDADWSQESYKRLAECNTVEKFWSIYNFIPTITTGMWFLMRKERNGKLIYPQWEDPAVINGGAWSFKIHMNIADNAWLDLSERLVGETLFENSEDIIGISASSKKNSVTIRVWNADNTKAYEFPRNIPNINFNESRYVNHCDN